MRRLRHWEVTAEQNTVRLLTVSTGGVAPLFPPMASLTVPGHLHLAHSGLSFSVFAFCIHSFSKHLRNVPYGPSLFLGFRQTERNRISESVIKKICIASMNKTINRMSFQTSESPFFLNTQVLTIWLMLIMQFVRIIDKIGPHSHKTPNPSKRSI